MDALTTKQKNQMYDEIADLVLRYGSNLTAKRMIKAFFNRVEAVRNAREFSAMEITLVALKYLLEITFPNK
jgi:hypothetical protein